MLDLRDYISRLDTERFGYQIARVDFHDQDNVDEIISFLNHHQIALIITRVRCEDIPLVNQLEQSGFKTMDFQVGYDYCGTKEIETQVSRSIYPVAEIKPVDIPRLIEIAANSFAGFGHYAADKRLDSKACLEIYQDWTRNVCTNKEFADVVYAAYDGAKPIGFVAFKAKHKNDSPMATAEIGAVSAGYEGKGIYQSLIQRGMRWAAARNLVLRDMKVHATNYSTNVALAKLGFRIRSAHITMHYWNENSGT